MQVFWLIRDEDVTGVSGTGIVAEGVVFEDGKVALRWLVENMPRSTVVWDSIRDAISVHGHDGRTRLSFASGINWPPAQMRDDHQHQWDEVPDHAGWYCKTCGEFTAELP